MIRVLIVEDQPIVRAGLSRLLAERSHFTVIGEASSGAEALERIRFCSPDIVLLDGHLPRMCSLDVLKEMKSRDPRLRVIVLGMHEDDLLGMRALRAGASGYVGADCSPQDLIAAIQRAAEGGTYMSSSLAEKLACSVVCNRAGASHDQLSDRELQVLRMVGGGMTVSQVADELSLSPKTVSTYRMRVLQKMGFKTDAELTRYVMRERLLDCA